MVEEIRYSLDNGLSREEHDWLSNRFTDSDKIQSEQIKMLQEQNKLLRTIKTTTQIVAVILVLIAVLVAFQLMGS